MVELGFGVFLDMGLGWLVKKLCAWLLAIFDTHHKTVELDGITYELNSAVFSEVIGISDGGRSIETCGRAYEILELKFIFKRNKKGLRRSEIEKVVVECTDGRGRFRQAFALFVVATVLGPISGSHILTFWLYNILDVDVVRTCNWAS